MTNPNQNLNTPRTQIGFLQMLGTLGPGAASAYSNWVANMQLSADTPQTQWFRDNFPLVANEVLKRIAEGSATVAGVPQSAASAILLGIKPQTNTVSQALVVAAQSVVQTASDTVADIAFPVDTSQNSSMNQPAVLVGSQAAQNTAQGMSTSARVALALGGIALLAAIASRVM